MIESAQRLPEPGAGAGLDISSPFARRLPAHHKVVDDEPGPLKGVPTYEFKANVKFFTIPDDAEKYEAILDLVLSGAAILRYEDKTYSKDGDFLVTICYLTPKPGSVTAKKRRDEDEDEEFIVRSSQS